MLNSIKAILTGRTLLAGAAMGIALSAGAFTSAHAQSANQQIDGWYKECTKQAENDVCVVQNITTAPSGQLITAIGLVQVTGKTNQKLVQISVPIARYLPPGISIQVDGGKQTRIPYAVCLPDKCIAQAELTDALVNTFKAGGEAVFTSVNAQRAANPIRVSLSGFTQAYDGEPIGRAEIEEKAKAREDEIRKKLEESRAKLQAAQDAAKNSE